MSCSRWDEMGAVGRILLRLGIVRFQGREASHGLFWAVGGSTVEQLPRRERAPSQGDLGPGPWKCHHGHVNRKGS